MTLIRVTTFFFYCWRAVVSPAHIFLCPTVEEDIVGDGVLHAIASAAAATAAEGAVGNGTVA